jgi:hypothetical protein
VPARLQRIITGRRRNQDASNITVSLPDDLVCVPITSNLTWAEAPENVLLLRGKVAGLPKDCVANVSQIVALDRWDASLEGSSSSCSRGSTSYWAGRDRGRNAGLGMGRRRAARWMPTRAFT